VLKVTQMPFVKGQPRPLNAGRKKGTPNKKTLERMAREDAAKLLEAKALENDLPLDTCCALCAIRLSNRIGGMLRPKPPRRTSTRL